MIWQNVDSEILLVVRMLIGDEWQYIEPHNQEFIGKVGSIRFGKPAKYLMPLTRRYIEDNLVKIRYIYKKLNFLEAYSQTAKSYDEA